MNRDTSVGHQRPCGDTEIGSVSQNTEDDDQRRRHDWWIQPGKAAHDTKPAAGAGGGRDADPDTTIMSSNIAQPPSSIHPSNSSMLSWRNSFTPTPSLVSEELNIRDQGLYHSREECYSQNGIAFAPDDSPKDLNRQITRNSHGTKGIQGKNYKVATVPS